MHEGSENKGYPDPLKLSPVAEEQKRTHTHMRMHTHTHTHTRTRNMYAHTCTHRHTRMHARTHACTHACTHARTHTHTAHTHTHTHTHKHTHTHTLTHTHKHTLKLPQMCSLSVQLGAGLCVFTTITDPLCTYSPLNPDALRGTSQYTDPASNVQHTHHMTHCDQYFMLSKTLVGTEL